MHHAVHLFLERFVFGLRFRKHGPFADRWRDLAGHIGKTGLWFGVDSRYCGSAGTQEKWQAKNQRNLRYLHQLPSVCS